MCRPTSSDGGPVVSHTQHPVGNRVSVALRCATARPSLRKITTAVATAPQTRPLPAVSRAHPPRDVDRLSSGVRREGRGGGDSPARRPRADGRCTSPVALPPYPPPWRFWARNCRLCWSSADGMGSCHRPGTTAPGPAGNRPSSPPPFAPPPAIQLRSPR